MFKKFRVEATSEKQNIIVDCIDLDTALDIYDSFTVGRFYENGHIMDNETGEIYTYFNWDKVKGFEMWVSNDLLK